MASATDEIVPSDFERTCWREIEVSHPADWEAGFLSAADAPGRCAFVDRRYQRLEVQWRKVQREPDLRQMYKRIAKSFGDRDHPTSALVGAADWEGVVRRERAGSVVHAGRYFRQGNWLVQTVLVWPGRRDRRIELGVLRSIAPRPAGPTRRWRALGLSVLAPAAFELASCENQVGRVTWEFRRPGRRAVAVTVERIAMSRYWLKKPLGDWLKTQLPSGYVVTAERTTRLAVHDAVELHSWQRNPLRGALGLRTRRVDLAWTCPAVQRVYRVGLSRRTRDEIDRPAPLEVDCCRPVAVGGASR